MRHVLIYLLLSAVAILSGCGQDYSLNPSPGGEHVVVTVKVPDELSARKMQVIYRSTLCTFTDHSASGNAYQRDGYTQLEVEPARLASGNLFQALLAKNGGGDCQWRLSNVMFGVTYKSPNHFGDNVNGGAGGTVVVIFDTNNSPVGGSSSVVSGDLTIKKDYYPWVSESFIGRYSRDIKLFDESQRYHLSFRATTARNIYFEPVFHAGYVVLSEGPRIKQKGSYVTFIYPDGTIERLAKAKPSFQKLQAIRFASENTR